MTIGPSSLRAALAPLICGLALSGCTLFDAKAGEVRLEPPGPIRTNGPVAIRIVAAAGASKARLLLDGRELGTFVVGRDHVLDLAKEAEGSHRLVARAYDGDRAVDSRALQVVIDRAAPRAKFSPAPGEIVTEGPLVVLVDFDAPVSADVTGPGRVTLRSGVLGDLAFTAVLEPGGSRLVVTSAVRFLEVEPVTLQISARDVAGNPVQTTAFYAAPHLRVDMFFETASGGLSGVVGIRVRSWQPARATSLAVDVDGVPLGNVQAGQTLAWDTRSSPGNAHRLTFRAPGHVPYAVDAISDNNDAPPTLVLCSPHGAAADDAALVRGVEVTLSEVVCHEAYVSGGSCFDRTPPRPDFSWYDSLVVRPPLGIEPLPFTWQVDLRSYRDPSGQAVAGTPSCSIAFPAWRKPWGADPIQDGALPLQGEAVLLGRFSLDRETDEAGLLRIAPAGAARAGTVGWFASVAPEAIQVVLPVLNGDTEAAASQLRARKGIAAWVERHAGGGETIRAFSPAQGDAADVATVVPARGPVALAQPGSVAVGWIDTGAAGNRELHVAFTRTGEVHAPAHADPATDASEATVEVTDFGTLRVAFLETRAGGVPQLRLRELPADTTAWRDRGGTLNRDPAQAASDPAFGSAFGDPNHMAIAWVEGGQVLARRVDPGDIGPAQVLNADPAAPARAPRVLNHRLVFVERDAGGDVFQVREWNHVIRAWATLPSLPAGGEVAAWSAQEFPLAILWQDAAGAWRLRVYNE